MYDEAEPMTDEVARKLFGDAAFELKAAETEHRRNVGRATTIAREFKKLSDAVAARAKAAELAGDFPQNNQDEPLSLTNINAPYVDVNILKEVDRDISASVARLVDARRQYERLKP